MLWFEIGLQKLRNESAICFTILYSSIFLLFIFRISHGFRQSFPRLPGIKPGATSYIDSSFLNVVILKKGNSLWGSHEEKILGSSSMLSSLQ